MKIIIIILFALTLISCMTPPNSEQLNKADYGYPMILEAVKPDVKAYFQRALKDPQSAQYSNWSITNRSWMKDGPIFGGKTHYGDLVEVNVNAKNSFGGYVGATSYKFLFHNGRIKVIYKLSKNGKIWQKIK